MDKMLLFQYRFQQILAGRMGFVEEVVARVVVACKVVCVVSVVYTVVFVSKCNI